MPPNGLAVPAPQTRFRVATPSRRTPKISNWSSPEAEDGANAGGFRNQGVVARVRADAREVHIV